MVYGLLVLSLLLPFACAEASLPSYSFSIGDPIPRIAQAEVTEALMGLSNTAAPSKAHIALEKQMLSMYGITLDGLRDTDIAEWVFKEMDMKGNVTRIPEEITTVKGVLAFLTERAEPGDLLFYRTNGLTERFIPYLGPNQTLQRQMDSYRITEIPITFTSGGTERTVNTGIFALAHMWSEEPGATERTHLGFTREHIPGEFTGECYRLYVRTGSEEYVRSTDYVVVEKEPGVFDIWDGKEFGLNPAEWIYDAVVILEKQESGSGGLPERIKIRVPGIQEEAQVE